jgi:hypothetical protein
MIQREPLDPLRNTFFEGIMEDCRNAPNLRIIVVVCTLTTRCSTFRFNGDIVTNKQFF